jgi:hypothetical protein
LALYSSLHQGLIIDPQHITKLDKDFFNAVKEKASSMLIELVQAEIPNILSRLHD